MTAIQMNIEQPFEAVGAGVTDYDDVHDHASFVGYISVLREELNDPVLREEWENPDLPSFLDAIVAWTTDRGHHTNPNFWQHMAEILTAATIYKR